MNEVVTIELFYHYQHAAACLSHVGLSTARTMIGSALAIRNLKNVHGVICNVQ